LNEGSMIELLHITEQVSNLGRDTVITAKLKWVLILHKYHTTFLDDRHW